jgi:hypothetical protein
MSERPRNARRLWMAAALLAACTRQTELLIPPAAGAGPASCGPRCVSEGLGDNPGAAFTGPPDQAAPPVLVYPLAGTVLPRNLTPPTFQWRRTSDVTQTLFRLRLTGAADPFDFYLRCQPPTGTMTAPASSDCVYTPAIAAWRAAVAGSPGRPLSVSLAATSGAGAGVATATTGEVALSAAPLEGGVYYWSYADSGIHRALFGGAGRAVPFITPGSGANPQPCGGCHAVSRDGQTLAFSAGDLGYLTVARAASPASPLIAPPSPPSPNGSTMSVSADGSLVAVSYGVNGADAGHLVVRDTATGREVARLDPGVLGTTETRVLFPAWSPDGLEIAATLASHSLEARTATDGYLVAIPYNGGRFGRARVLVPADATLIHFAPDWSPDGRFILFVSAAPPGRLMNDVSYDNPSTRLRLARSDGTGVVSELSLVNQGGGHTAGWPRFVWSTSSGPWSFTFHSKLDYGVVLQNHAVAGPKGGLSQLWLSTIDPGLLPGDPSSAPLWLPFQDVHQINNMAFPAPLVCAPALLPPTGCAAGETCVGGLCQAP